jgi:hypothetical protein
VSATSVDGAETDRTLDEGLAAEGTITNGWKRVQRRDGIVISNGFDAERHIGSVNSNVENQVSLASKVSGGSLQ